MSKQQIRKICIAVVVLIVCALGIFKAGMTVGAANDAEPGSIKDPLITKSYLDAYMANYGGGEATAGYTKVTLSKGSTIIGKAGTEMVLYSGSANAYAKSSELVNISFGESVSDGLTLGKYCVYLCPDSDAGLTATSDVVIFIKGQYSKK